VYDELPYICSMGNAAKSKQKRELKNQRLELRVAPSAKALILRAMAVSGLPRPIWRSKAQGRYSTDHERMLLRGAARSVFLAAVRNPPQPSSRLTEAFRLYAAGVTH
jgi:uncharacterized protein (DUF1778 family)